MFITHIDNDENIFKEIVENISTVTITEKIDGISIIMGLDEKGPYIKRKYKYKYRIDNLDQKNHSHKTILKCFEFLIKLYDKYIQKNTYFETVYEYVSLARPNLISYLDRTNFKENTLIFLSGDIPYKSDIDLFNTQIASVYIHSDAFTISERLVINNYDYDGKIQLLEILKNKKKIAATEGFVLKYNNNLYKVVDNINFSYMNRKLQFNRDLLRPIIKGKISYTDQEKEEIMSLVEVKIIIDRLYYNNDSYIKLCKLNQEKEYLYIAKGGFDGWKML